MLIRQLRGCVCYIPLPTKGCEKGLIAAHPRLQWGENNASEIRRGTLRNNYPMGVPVPGVKAARSGRHLAGLRDRVGNSACYFRVSICYYRNNTRLLIIIVIEEGESVNDNRYRPPQVRNRYRGVFYPKRGVLRRRSE